MDTARAGALAAIMATLLTATTAACSEDTPGSIEILSPVGGDAVTVPFEVTVESSVPLGPPDEQDHHVHIWFGDDQSVFLVGESATIRVDNAPDGEQVMWVGLHRADHSPAGPVDSVTVDISGGSGTPG